MTRIDERTKIFPEGHTARTVFTTRVLRAALRNRNALAAAVLEIIVYSLHYLQNGGRVWGVHL